MSLFFKGNVFSSNVLILNNPVVSAFLRKTLEKTLMDPPKNTVIPLREQCRLRRFWFFYHDRRALTTSVSLSTYRHMCLGPYIFSDTQLTKTLRIMLSILYIQRLFRT